jgi:SAM-dependent methyltransferase
LTPPSTLSSKLETFRLFLDEREDPVPFHQRLAQQAVDQIGRDPENSVVIDLGCGPGHYTRALRSRGAFVVPIDLDLDEFGLPGGPPGGEVVANGMRLPFPDGVADGILCSNMIEHTPDPAAVVREMERVVKPGGWLWLSFTNWYSPWGGHDISPFHYLGPRRGLDAYRRFAGREPKNVPLQSLFPFHIGTALRLFNSRRGLRVLYAVPRYYPSQRWVLKIPGLRELATWNLLVLMERVQD